MRRQWAASEALVLGGGRMSTVAEATGLSRTTITAGLKAFQHNDDESPPNRIRRSGGGRRSRIDQDATLLDALDRPSGFLRYPSLRPSWSMT
jgi:hypothetical protein